MQVRRATMKDMMEMQHCNLRCLPENYNLRYYYYHYLSWPQMLHVLEDVNGEIAGYVLAKLDDEEDARKKHGHITSLAVLRTHRKLGGASALMKSSMREQREVDDANFCSLHVRKTNQAALHLYQESLNFRCVGVEEKYYVDDEDAYHMKRHFKMPSSKGGEDKIAYVTPHGELKWTRLDAAQLALLNGGDDGAVSSPPSSPSGSPPAAAAAASSGGGDGKAAATSSNNKDAAAGANNKGKGKGKGNKEPAVDVEAQLAELLAEEGGGGKKGAGGGGKKDGNKPQPKGKKGK